MLMDQQLQFSNAQAITATAPSTKTLDLLTGTSITTSGGTYTVPPAAVIGNASFYGADIGLGRGKGTPTIVGTVGTAFATLTSLQVQFRGAPDTGSAGTIAALTFTPYIQTDTIAAALLTANTRIFVFDWPTRKVSLALPRFVQLNYVVAGSNATAGTITADVTLGPDTANATLGQYPSNY